MNTNEFRQELIGLLCEISDPEEMDAALEAILTEKELDGIEKRLQIFRLLSSGATHREIAATLGVGIATVTRGANAYRRGKFCNLEDKLK